MNRRELVRLGALSGLILPSAGCATLWDLLNNFVKMPKMSVQKMDIRKMSLTSMSVTFHTVISNPNPFGFRLDGLDYLLRVAGDQLAKGTAPQGITLKPGGSARSDLDLDFDLGRTATAILELITKKRVDYELAAVGKFFSKQGGIDVPVGFKGVMPMPLLPKFAVTSFRATSVSASSVGFQVDTALDNDNDFEIPIDGLEFDLKLDGKNVLQNRAARGVRIPPKKTGRVPLSFNIALPALGVSLAQIASGKRMAWQLDSKIKSDKLVMPFTNKGQFTLSG